MESTESTTPTSEPNPDSNVHSAEPSTSTLILRSGFGGVLMGLANLVPGISGGTMLLVSGIYPRFVDAVAEVTRFKFKFRSLLVLAVVGLAAGTGILLLAGLLKDMVVTNRWVMYSLFIGLTLGGLPLVWKMARPIKPSVYIAAAISFALMTSLAVAQAMGIVGSGSSNFVTLLLAGLAGASAMILPGLSGGYILLLMNQYVPILDGIHEFKEALSNRDISAAMGPALSVMLPVGIGVLVGVALVSNIVKWLLVKYEKATLGFLVGLLLGSVVGLFPFQQGVAPVLGDVIKSQVVTADNIEKFTEKPQDWRTEYFSPSGGQIGGSIGLILLGLAVTIGVSKVGGDESV